MEAVAISSGVDWLTCTTSNDIVGQDWYSLFLGQARGQEISDWRNKWYQGRKTEGLRWGYSARQGYILICAGGTTPGVFLKVVPAARNTSRVDLQVTFELDLPKPELAEDYWDALPKREEWRRKYSFIQSTKGGATLYVGSRHSSQYGRLYDKAAQAGWAESGKIWRAEVELKPPYSGAIADLLHTKSRQKMLDDTDVGWYAWTTMIVPYVRDWFGDRGIRLPLDTCDKNTLVVEIGRKVTSDDKSIEWLRTQVAPTLDRLMRKGLEGRIAEAIGYNLDRVGS